jgi:hypothetical protein
MRPLPSAQEIIRAVQEHDDKYKHKEKEIWNVAQNARTILLQKASLEEKKEVSKEYVWEIKKWGRIQGVTLGEKEPMARALLDLSLNDRPFDPEKMSEVEVNSAVALVDDLVSKARARGVQNDHYSWVSKILHWLFPHQIPVYDETGRRFLGIAKVKKPAYHSIVLWTYKTARELLPWREQVQAVSCIPKSLLRAIDNYFWWHGSGKSSKATHSHNIAEGQSDERTRSSGCSF